MMGSRGESSNGRALKLEEAVLPVADPGDA